MANTDTANASAIRTAGPEPEVRRITFDDIKTSLAEGWDDFKAKPSFAVFLALIYPVIGLLLLQLTAGNQVFPILFPLMSGFALIGPFAAIGLYEISRRREAGQDTRWIHALEVLQSPSRGAIGLLGIALMGIFVAWLAAAWIIYEATMGSESFTGIENFVRDLLTTGPGWALIIIGNAVGFVFAVVALSLSIVSFPLLLDRSVGIATAVRTSFRVVTTNPVMVATWGIIVAASLVIGSLPFFIGLAIVLPLLAHATWHLYRKLVVW